MGDLLVGKYRYFLTRQGEPGIIRARLSEGVYLCQFWDAEELCVMTATQMANESWDFRFFRNKNDRDEAFESDRENARLLCDDGHR